MFFCTFRDRPRRSRPYPFGALSPILTPLGLGWRHDMQARIPRSVVPIAALATLTAIGAAAACSASQKDATFTGAGGDASSSSSTAIGTGGENTGGSVNGGGSI